MVHAIIPIFASLILAAFSIAGSESKKQSINIFYAISSIICLSLALHYLKLPTTILIIAGNILAIFAVFTYANEWKIKENKGIDYRIITASFAQVFISNALTSLL